MIKRIDPYFDTNAFFADVERYRRSQMLSKSALCREADVDRANYTRINNYGMQISLSTVCRLAKFCDLSIDRYVK